ncbi:hypothetical protein EDD18DRAFT_1126173 [Armillaria luteobubalina]|uniref:histone acetyltransferase n=1 Tax=Armillaria luteobubalina TaxID=153913 RepID=A0AA39UV66_9AGAR|nr:hypothetical protein EDD18DRAFT_1126173 [Armillaria luteobubalina]
MKYAYPVSHVFSKLDTPQLSLKIARHSPCTRCACTGLHPDPDDEVVFDDEAQHTFSIGDLGQYGSDDEDANPPYLEFCGCGHGLKEHDATEAGIGVEEFLRRSRVAVRLDELLQDAGKLLDFDYIDDDITSLRKQMRLPVSAISPSQALGYSRNSDGSPPTKRRRLSLSSLSEADDDDDDDEEDKPLAARVNSKTGSRPEKTARKSGQKSGKKGPGKVPKGKTNGASRKGHKSKGVNGINGHSARVKVEEKLGDEQLTRLATGVPVDASSPNEPVVRTEKMAAIELRKGVIKITSVENDKHPRSYVILTGLKTLFQKQLPKMPREYIARLVYDANSKALAIIKRGYKVVGGICYRPFPHRGFAEIVFFATASVDQVKGYGGMLMDHFKAHIRKTYPNMMYFLTYADNYAVGYFEKQGFSKEITLDRSVWAGYIKDYEGGTIMQCTMLRKVDYLDKVSIITQQQEAVISKIREMSRSHIIHPGLPQFQSGNDEITVDPKDVPGLRECGWTPEMMMQPLRVTPRSADHGFMDQLLRDLQDHGMAWPFQEPVKREDVPDYYDVITNPMDFKTMEHKLETHQYGSVDDFVSDANLIWENCRAYNPPDSIYQKAAAKLEKLVATRMAERNKRED